MLREPSDTIAAKAKILDALKFSEGNIFVAESRSRTEFYSFLKEIHSGMRRIEFLDLDTAEFSEVYSATASMFEVGGVVVWSSVRTFPKELALVARVWLKGDGLVDPRTGCVKEVTSKCRPVLLIFLEEAAWLSLTADVRGRLSSVLVGGGHWLVKMGVRQRQPLAALEAAVTPPDGDDAPIAAPAAPARSSRKGLQRWVIVLGIVVCLLLIWRVLAGH